jgi:hypothetical protein
VLVNLTVIVAVYVCFRCIEIGLRELRARKWLVPVLAVVAILVTTGLTYETVRQAMKVTTVSALVPDYENANTMTEEQFNQWLNTRYPCAAHPSTCSDEDRQSIATIIVNRSIQKHGSH